MRSSSSSSYSRVTEASGVPNFCEFDNDNRNRLNDCVCDAVGRCLKNLARSDHHPTRQFGLLYLSCCASKQGRQTISNAGVRPSVVVLLTDLDLT